MQDLTPLEIQKQSFSKKFKGYEPAEVHGYLNLVAEEIERLIGLVEHGGRKTMGEAERELSPLRHFPCTEVD